MKKILKVKSKTKLNKKKLEVNLSAEDRQKLILVVKSGKHNVRVITRARILLLSDSGKTNREIVEFLNCAPRMICDVRQKYLKEKNVLIAIEDLPRPGQPKKITLQHEAYVTATASTNAPKGHNHWTLPELKKQLLKRYRSLETVSEERIRQILLKNTLKPWLKKNVVYT